MTKLEVLKTLIKEMLKQTKDENYHTIHGQGYKQGYIEAIEDILKLI